ncbi:hypothetical protein MX629_08215 [Carnobacterium divergens]|uniref:DUF3899 domain-containing protein n=1 Tax=Carnobacterium divergens TaxID=2748 RepID=A0AAW8RF35_CARDV|nr:hypothetical protein [Carnobacterium divergens]MDT1958402.1 hypothetical protein [Carnobacterium divergens]MDT1974251.1 hypothetical protein [Carnobacterium divergens]
MTAVILGILLLVFPLTNVPAMIKSKKKNNRYFLGDPRILVSKNSNMGNNLNMQNKYTFFFSILLSLVLIILGMYLIVG